MTETAVIGDPYAMRASPPDILLTNYKMLDMLLLRSEDVPLFHNAGESLRYLVLDEFHTYDGAQGTDVAMLLRRLGVALGVTTDERPLGAITPVATSATLGGGTEGGPALRDFAETAFGAEFDATSIIGEDRLTIDEWVTDREGDIPLLDEVTITLQGCASHEEQLQAGERLFLGATDLDDEALGQRLRAHPLTHSLLRLTEAPRSLSHLAQEAEPSWAATDELRTAAGRNAVALYLALSRARANGAPLLGVDVQLWVREVSRLLRGLTSSPMFRCHGGGRNEIPSFGVLPALWTVGLGRCRHGGR